MSKHVQPQTLKVLQTRKSKVTVQLQQLRQDLTAAKRAVVDKEKQLRNLDEQIRAATAKPMVTEHAIIRYLEAKGMCMDEVRANIMNDSVRAAMKAVGSGKFPIEPGIVAVVKGNTVVSVLGGERTK
jgi:hypothetical protein